MLVVAVAQVDDGAGAREVGEEQVVVEVAAAEGRGTAEAGGAGEDDRQIRA